MSVPSVMADVPGASADAAAAAVPSEMLADQQAAKLLARASLFVLCIAAPAALAMLIALERPFGLRWIAVAELLAVGGGVRIALRAGKVKLAGHVLQWGLLALVSIQTVIVGGIRTPSVMAYPLLLMLGGWLLGRRAALCMLAATLAWLSFLALSSDRYWPEALHEPGAYWITAVLACGMATLLAAHIAKSARRQREAERLVTAELARRLDQLQQTRDKLATLFHLNPVPVSVTRIADGTFSDANPAWARISGWSRGEMIGKTASELGIWTDPAHRQAFVDTVQREGRVFNYITQFRMRDGQLRHFLMSAEVVEYDGEPSVFSAFVDVTERRKAEASLERLNAELEQRVAERTQSLTEALDTLRRAQDELVQSDKLASLGSLVAGVAHELNTPIGNAVLISSTLMQDLRALETAYRSGDLRKSSLESFIADAGRALALLDQSVSQASDLVSSFKQVAIDQTSERRRSFALSALVRDVCETVRPSMRNDAWQLDTVLAPDVEMDSYPGPLGQVLTNLVQNAFFHGLQENQPGRVCVETRLLDDAHVELCVSDDGRGIAPENLGRIFDPFFTTRLGQGGSGLGLSIVYRLVTTLLGGRLSVDSVPGRGTSFCVVLPRTAPQTA